FPGPWSAQKPPGQDVLDVASAVEHDEDPNDPTAHLVDDPVGPDMDLAEVEHSDAREFGSDMAARRQAPQASAGVLDTVEHLIGALDRFAGSEPPVEVDEIVLGVAGDEDPAGHPRRGRTRRRTRRIATSSGAPRCPGPGDLRAAPRRDRPPAAGELDRHRSVGVDVQVDAAAHVGPPDVDRDGGDVPRGEVDAPQPWDARHGAHVRNWRVKTSG